jgi:hypothetical protein
MRALILLLLLPGLAMAMGTPPQKQAVAAPGAAGVMLREEVLRAAPNAAAESLAKLGKGATVRVLGNDGGWTQVHIAGTTGWVRILSVKSDLSATPDLGALAEVGKRPSDPGRVVAVAGVRGLDEEELKAARYDPEALHLLDTFASTRADAEAFARMAGLSPREVPYLPKPEIPASSTSSQP